ncbi:MAG TPA: Zn-dependent hydrolase [Methylomirabilota bacterium]|jgi:N-carbamoyl-L-amino-acid hydrolase|nr:Zn-dependent hydrolase [Methylomirabilota bacterium]
MTTTVSELRVNGERLWDTIMASARIGPGRTPTGLRRLALTDADREMRDLFARWCREAGCVVTVDRMGNMFARRPGRDDTMPPVLVGSHLDTQIAGGRYDGILGVLAALEVVRTLNDASVQTRRPIEIVNWTNEEGARFQPPMLGSAVFAGVRTLEWAHARADDAGRTVGEELARIGYAGAAAVGGRPVDAYFELHIEQGPLLDDKGVPVGVVAGTYGVRGLNIEVRGETAHSGPTPMAARRNALVGAAMLIVAVNDIGWSYAPDGKATTSRIEVWPNLAGILPDYAKVTVDVRHPEAATVDRMLADVKRAMADCGQRAQVEMAIVEAWQFGSERFDAELVDLIRNTAGRLGTPSLDLPSQAGHDAYYVSRVAPTAMIFTPCDGGISHNERESTRLADALPGVNVLLQAVLARANR